MHIATRRLMLMKNFIKSLNNQFYPYKDHLLNMSYLCNQGKKINIDILIVDDHPENLLAIEAVIENSGYNLVCANSGEEALKWVLKKDFAVIILDVQMPGLNGFDTARIIKSRPSSAHTPIIFMTAINQSTENVKEGFAVGAIDYIFKPFDPYQLRSKVDGFVKIHLNQLEIKQQKENLKKYSKELERANRKLKELTAKLQKAEATERIIEETSIDTIVIHNDKGIITKTNPAIEKMFGYRQREMIGKKFNCLLMNTEREMLINNISIDGNQSIIELTGIRKDGSQFPVHIHFRRAKVEDEYIYVCSIRDITERKEIEQVRINSINDLEIKVHERTTELVKINENMQNEILERNRITHQLRLSNRKLANVLESIGAAFCAIDNKWCFTYVNREFEEQVGVNRKNIIGKHIIDVVKSMHPLVIEKITCVFTTRIPLKFEFYFEKTKNWFDIRMHPFENGISIYFDNITKRKAMERDLSLSQERFKKIFNSSPHLLAIISLEGNGYIDVNNAWIEMTGYTYEEAIGSKVNLINPIIEGKGRLKTAFEKENFEPLRNVKINYMTKSKSIRHGLLSREFIEIQGEKCVICAITDITERMLLENEMTRLDRLNLVGEMAAGIAHEIRNPMTTVRGFLQVAKENPTDQYFDLMINELDRANDIITEYLTLAKNKATYQTPQQINQIVKVLYPLIKAEATLSGKQIVLQLEDCPVLQLDEKEIRQMLLNLCFNGLEAMSQDGILTIKTYATEDKVCLEIIDQGSGIKKEDLEKIGTPFFTTKENGTGLGLSVCYSVANRHNASITIDSSEQGTTFKVQFQR